LHYPENPLIPALSIVITKESGIGERYGSFRKTGRWIMEQITDYSKGLSRDLSEICDVLKREIEAVLSAATSKIYYSMPVWFIDDNPIVGYKASAKNVTLLFWSGQAFGEEGLKAAGKFKAAQAKFSIVHDIDLASLRRWLEKSKATIWSYKNIRTTGELKPVKMQ
jgi:hypothetical protein